MTDQADLIKISNAILPNGETIRLGDTVRLTCHHRPEFKDGGTYQVAGLFQHLDNMALMEPRTVQQAELLKIGKEGKLLNWSWAKMSWEDFVSLGEPAIYAEVSWLQKVEKTILGGVP